MSAWTDNNQRPSYKSFDVNLSGHQGEMFTILVRLNPKTWRWEPEIRGPHAMGKIEPPDVVDLTARSPRRAAGKALEYLLELDDHGELKH